MKLVSPLLKHVIYPGLSKSGYLRRFVADGPAVLTYHGVFPEGYEVVDEHLDGNLVSAMQLRAQLRSFKDEYELITPEDFLQWCERKISLPPRALLLTCDDGLRNNLTTMLPMLQEFGAKCLFFVTGTCTEPAGGMLWHERLHLQLLFASDACTLDLSELGIDTAACGPKPKNDLWHKLTEVLSSIDAEIRGSLLEKIRMQLGLSESWISLYQEGVLAERFQTMNLSDLGRLAAAGMCIGAHSRSHSRLSRMPAEWARREIQENRQDLSRALGQKIWAFAYPFGNSSAVSAREMALAEECGFTCAFLNMESSRGHNRGLFALPRIHVTRDMKLAELEARISGFHTTLRQAFV